VDTQESVDVQVPWDHEDRMVHLEIPVPTVRMVLTEILDPLDRPDPMGNWELLGSMDHKVHKDL
jgi:hypothetical protein